MSKTIPAISLFGNTIDIDRDKFRIRVAGYALVTNNNQILLVKTKSTNKWFFPGGEVEVGEQIEEALKRELKEEAGIEVEIEKFLTFKEVFFYYDPADQALQNYGLYFKCKPVSLDLDGTKNVADDESYQPTWVDMDTLNEDDFQKGAYEIFLTIK